MICIVLFSSFHAVAPDMISMSDNFVVPENSYTPQDVSVYSRTVNFLPSTDVSACESSSNAAARVILKNMFLLDYINLMNELPSRC